MRDFISDDFQFVVNLTVWVPNLLIAFPIVMEFEDKIQARGFFLGSAYVAASAPFFFNWIYCGWQIFDFLLQHHLHPNWYVFIKVFFSVAFTATSTWLIADLLPRVFVFWNELRELELPEFPERPTEESEEFIF